MVTCHSEGMVIKTHLTVHLDKIKVKGKSWILKKINKSFVSCFPAVFSCKTVVYKWLYQPKLKLIAWCLVKCQIAYNNLS